MVNFGHRGEMEHWLISQPREAATAIAARAVLRVLPLIAVDQFPTQSLALSNLVLACCRAAGVSWTTVQFSIRDARFRTAANAAASAAGNAAADADAANAVVAAAAANAANVAAVAADADGDGGAIADAAGAVGAAFVAAAAANGAAANANINAVAADADAINAAGDRAFFFASEQAGASLWPINGFPRSIEGAWLRLKTVLLAADEGWDVWIDWYEDRLAGRPANPDLERARFTLPEELWQQGPKAVNAEIRRLIEERRADRDPPAEMIPAQGAGPHFSFGPNGKITLAPPTEIDADGNHIARIRQLLPLVRRAADDLAGHLNPNAFPELSRSLADYRTAIAAEETRIAWGLVFGLGVMLENSAEAARRSIEDRLHAPLEDPAQSALASVLSLHGPLILATAEGRELVDDADRMRRTREEQTRLRDDAEVIAGALKKKPELIEAPAAEVVDKAADITSQGRYPERGTVYWLATARNIATILIPAAFLGAFSWWVGGFGGSGVASAGSLILRENERVRNAARALGSEYDRLINPPGIRRSLSGSKRSNGFNS